MLIVGCSKCTEDGFCTKVNYVYEGSGSAQEKFALIEVSKDGEMTNTIKHRMGFKINSMHTVVQFIKLIEVDDNALFLFVAFHPEAYEGTETYDKGSAQSSPPQLYYLSKEEVTKGNTSKFIKDYNITDFYIQKVSFAEGGDGGYVVVKGHWRKVPYSVAQPTRPSKTWVNSYVRRK